MKFFKYSGNHYLMGCMIFLFAQSVLAGDPIAGEKVFQKCKACHEIAAEKNKIGPSLHGVIGRKAGGSTSFANYSDAFKNTDITWSEEVLKEFLQSPMTYIKGTRMFFTGIKSEQEIDDLIAYIKSSSH